LTIYTLSGAEIEHYCAFSKKELNFSPGVYLFKIKLNDHIEYQKLILTK
tara:strand:- start:562 stop:708 length:147 start_codon:yes stop_codon:yes gene_type:complete